MKYVVIEMSNCNLDAGYQHESGVVTCSTGNSFPLVLTRSKLIGAYDEAEQLANKIYEEALNAFGDDLHTEDGWFLSSGFSGARKIYVNKVGEDDNLRQEWVYSVKVLAIEE